MILTEETKTFYSHLPIRHQLSFIDIEEEEEEIYSKRYNTSVLELRCLCIFL